GVADDGEPFAVFAAAPFWVVSDEALVDRRDAFLLACMGSGDQAVSQGRVLSACARVQGGGRPGEVFQHGPRGVGRDSAGTGGSEEDRKRDQGTRGRSSRRNQGE